ncbi:CAP domain-containing protein [Oscillospiraceae bacterium MB08-C2-2]|nr:CAP domain-containing protein [Oscillospiraceae bacterium MB08-C2-2]
MNKQWKKNLRLIASGAASALVVAAMATPAMAASSYRYITNSDPSCTYAGIVRQFSSGSANCNNSNNSNCNNGSNGNNLNGNNGSNANCNNGNTVISSYSPSDLLNSFQSGNVDLNNLYNSLCPNQTTPTNPDCNTGSSCPSVPVTPTPSEPEVSEPSAPTPSNPKPSNPTPSNPGSSDNSNSDDGSATTLETQMLDLINAERKNAGVAPLTLNSELSKVARLKSQDMIDRGYFDHTSPTYGTPFEMMSDFGISYKTAGENLAKNAFLNSAHTSLMQSEGHRKNILNSSFTEIGLGIVTDSNGYLYITQMFIG